MQLEEEKIKEEEEEEVESVCSNQSLEMAPLTESELHLFKKLFHDQSKGIFQTRDKDINSKEMWIEILTEYNRRAQQSNEQPQQNWMDVIKAGKQLHSTFCIQRSLAEQGCQQERDPILMEIFDPCDTCKKKVIVSPLSLLSEELRKQRGAVDVNLNQIFEFCETCKGKIPSFPTSMMTSSSGLGSRTFSSIGGEVEGRFVRPCLAPVAPADHEQIKAAIDVLTAMGTKKLIDVQTLWKLAGHCSWGNLDLIMVLKSPATLEEKAELVKGYPLEG
ncbi:uncharacterized protein LOC130991679 [Salvia miltiorrhiza]|uniref:uncharacterized protein LOC130991679 n=1 Tax=Salvia miltiorrhiza TaxID=226208 RepID=UPI0025AD7F8D|nr:uncharacterized protein LOC130991679 [Salvia miltiorrhiza]XP_057772000.1 uncharacterized protein LOC130991679 [Salvia miltiorrhiza]XP_057772001.1 uncharacterized protein LOC130991679 [Salvia miltiorrhiza]